MCLTPITIDNPYYNKDPSKGYNFLHDCVKQKIAIPCGVCSECVNLEQMYLIQRVQMESINNYLYMGTCTYDNEHMPMLETSQGYKYRYCDIKHVTTAFRRLRDKNTYGIPFRYIAVTEKGTQKGRPHMHCLLLFKKEDIGDYYDAITFEQEHKFDLFQAWSINKGTKRTPIYETLSQYRTSIRHHELRATYDFHYVNPAKTSGGITDAAFYVLKYMLKDTAHDRKIKQALDYYYRAEANEETGEIDIIEDEELKQEAKDTWNTIRNRRNLSIAFGLNDWFIEGKNREIKEQECDKDIINHIREGIEQSKRAKQPYALFYGVENLLTFPLSPYYKEKEFLYNMEDEITFWKNRPHDIKDTEQRTTTELIKKFNDYERKLERLSEHEICQYLDEEFEELC